MSINSGVIADELSILVRPNVAFDAGQRALWHMESVGRIVDSSSPDLSPELELLSAVPQTQKGFSSSGAFSHSTSSEEFGLRMFPSSPPSPNSESTCKYVRICSKTRLRFYFPKAITVFSLDLSPSMNVVDTSFKSVTLGCHLVDTLVRALELSLKALQKDSGPLILVTVVAHGVPGQGVLPLVVGRPLSGIAEIINQVNSELRRVIQRLCVWLQQNHTVEQLAGSASCSRTRNPCTSKVCQANDVNNIIKDALTAIPMSCSEPYICKSILIVTDGVLSHPRTALMHLNFVDVTLHIIQVGGGFAPWSALGYASDPDLLGLLAASTPMGLFLQDHHLEAGADALWLACISRVSSLTSKETHTPYRAASYQSSTGEGWGFSSYLGQLGLARKEHTIQLQGIEEPLGSSLDSWSPINKSDMVFDSDSDHEQPLGGPMSLRAYLKPEKSKARPYLFKQYKLPNVSASLLVQLRVREGFTFCPAEKSQLTRTASLSALSASDDKTAAISLSTHWGPVVDVIYEITPPDTLIKIYLRMPSGDFFLRFKQQVAGGGPEAPFGLGQMCMQLNGFVESILSVDDGMAKISSKIPSETALLHRWCAVRPIFILLKLDMAPLPARLRQGTLDGLLRASREQLVREISEFPGIETVESGKRFVSPNVAIVDIDENGGENYTLGIVKINLAFIANSPNVQETFVRSLVGHINAGSLVERPSCIVRAVQATKPVRKQVRKKSVGLSEGDGESFYTFDPDVETLSRFMRCRSWETGCPPAALASDVLTGIHQRRIAQGWHCVYESTNAAIYLHFTQLPSESRSGRIVPDTGARNIWVPLPKASHDSPDTNVNTRHVTADWEKLMKTATTQIDGSVETISGACMCLSVQHVQARGEKPVLKCRFWVDREHPNWPPSVSDSELVEFCAEL